MHRTLRHLRATLFRWLALASSTAAFACGPGLVELRALRTIADSAKASCRADKAKCASALACAESASAAAKGIQSAQEARASGTTVSDKEAAAAGAYYAARATCAQGGWR